jgi:predicted PurR-regulated permease PerM
VAVLTIYFLPDLPRLRRGAVLLFPHAHRARFSRIADVLIDKVGAYMIGNIVVSILAGLAAFAALTGLGVPFAVPLAFVVAVFDLVPMIGAMFGAVIASWSCCSPPAYGRPPCSWPRSSCSTSSWRTT